MDRATVAKYADMDDMTPKPPMDRRRGSKIDPYAALVDEWLEVDRMLPRKQRHTAKRVHDRLRAETGYDGEYTTTPGYVRRWREANRSGSDGYGELVWAPGVAQIDFGVAKARIAGELVDDHCLVVTFPHSNMRYVTSLPGENAECLCHGLVEVFECFCSSICWLTISCRKLMATIIKLMIWNVLSAMPIAEYKNWPKS